MKSDKLEPKVFAMFLTVSPMYLVAEKLAKNVVTPVHSLQVVHDLPIS